MTKYLLVIVEKSNTNSDQWVVNTQDGSLPVEVHAGSQAECSVWAKENAQEVIGG
jgi:hypothetical protein